ncbi:MAG TPA: hypothetical protein VN688_01000 [Gemmataceae bacterium]|nr:hypothetical protein [Gemmataceae bacterium]
MPGGPKHNADSVLIAHLASGKSVEATAKLAGVSDVTVYRRLKNLAFRSKVRQARADVLERALGHLSKGAAEASIVLRNLLRDDDHRLRLGAARAILGLGDQLRESEETDARLAALEEQVRKLTKEKAHGHSKTA